MKKQVKNKNLGSSLEEYITLKQAQAKLNCSRGTLYNIIKTDGSVHKYKIQGGTRLSVLELQDYMERQKQLLITE